MAITKAQKQKILEGLREKIARQKAIVLVGITGLKVKDLSALRKKLKLVGAQIQVIKKTLADLVFKEKKLDFKKDQFKEEVAFVFGFEDEISPAKTVYQFSKENEKVKILGGFVENQFKGKEDIVFLAQIPTREELLARLVGSISSPISGFVSVLQAPLEACIFIIRSFGENKIGK